jgi:hypothetical protein
VPSDAWFTKTDVWIDGNPGEKVGLVHHPSIGWKWAADNSFGGNAVRRGGCSSDAVRRFGGSVGRWVTEAGGERIKGAEGRELRNI